MRSHIFLDTPGQIEVFTWSASGSLMTDSLGSTFPTVLLYVVDTPRCTQPATFMSNMLYACSIFYKTKLPMVVVFNKTDVASHKVRGAAGEGGRATAACGQASGRGAGRAGRPADNCTRPPE